MPSHGAKLEEIETLYRRRLADFRRVAAAIVGDPDRARDLVQDAFATAVQRRREFRGDGPLDAWLWRIVVNRARSSARASMETRGEAAAALRQGPNGAGADADSHLAAAVALLPERQRLVLFLRYYADLDYATIADVAGIEPGTVAATLHSARSSMRRLLQEVPR